MGHPFLYVTFSVRPSICCTPYLRNCALFDYNYWYAYVKWWCLQVFFHFFKILIFWVRVKNNPKWRKILSCYLSQEPYIIWLSLMVHISKRIISVGVFFNFSKFWFSRLTGWAGEGGGGVKGQKMAPKWQKFCLFIGLLHLIFQESYIIWSSFMVQMCERMISPGILFIFSKFWFSRSLGR